MPSTDDLFPGFQSARIPIGNETTIFTRSAGSGPPVLLLHGFPQTQAMWHKVAPRLAEFFTVVLMDLRGYGLSTAVENSINGSAYSKRTMGEDAVAVMAYYGFSRFSLVGHDRGARVAYRLALDHPECLEKVSLLDVVPTLSMFEQMSRIEVSMRAWHFLLFAQPAPLPETLLGNSLETYSALWFGSTSSPAKMDLDGQYAFHPVVREEYLVAMKDPKCLHAMMEDYRAAAFQDQTHDREDIEAGKKTSVPMQLLWAQNGLVGAGKFNAHQEWSHYATNIVDARAMDCGHFIPEESPSATFEALKAFLS